MATRLLLTLLALLTGLAAQLSPAQARVRAERASEIGALAALAHSERVSAVKVAFLAPRAERRVRDLRCDVVVRPTAVACVPTVLLGIDRARE